MTEHLLNILLVEDDEVDVMNVRRAFLRARVEPAACGGQRTRGARDAA